MTPAKMSARTPEWRFDSLPRRSNFEERGSRFSLCGPNTNAILSKANETDAAFIVTACNAYDADRALIASLVSALRTYVLAQSRMLDKWTEGDENVKRDLWRNLHACEDAARAALSRAEKEGA